MNQPRLCKLTNVRYGAQGHAGPQPDAKPWGFFNVSHPSRLLVCIIIQDISKLRVVWKKFTKTQYLIYSLRISMFGENVRMNVEDIFISNCVFFENFSKTVKNLVKTLI